MTYQRLNNIFGILVGILATTVYAMTMESTVSFWDCGEFISGAFKLQVAHPPGAPLFLMIGRFFTLFTSNPAVVAKCVNFSSALSTGAAMMFLFWTITALAKKLMQDKKGELTPTGLWATIGAGVVGAMAACFADSIWFSAVEGEVYAMSLFFTAIVFWAMIKWDEVATSKNADRWIILIAFLMGLSTGVHLLNLLTIPAIAVVYYNKRYVPTLRGQIIAFLIGGLLLAFVQFGIIQQLPSIAAFFDRMFVNGMGMAKNTGSILFLLMLSIGLGIGLFFTHRSLKQIYHTALLAITFIIIGYSSVLMVPIRSLSDPPIDMNNPDNPYSLVSYLNRDQYGDVPHLFGHYYTDRPERYEQGGVKYGYNERMHRYDTAGYQIKPVFNSESAEIIFPRIWDYQEARFTNYYKDWLQLQEGETPTYGDNLKFFFGYQVNHMYFRYFMWNFAGRQNDIQGHDNNHRDGSWISGIPFLDKARLDYDSSEIAAEPYKNNKGTNKFFLLPLLLGIVGLLFQFKKDKNNGIIVFLLFFMTGLAIVLYLNQPPMQPRERDYSYAGSFYAFCIWIGLGVVAIVDFLRKRLKMDNAILAIGVTVICFLAVPTVMGKQGWDDHDRSNRTVALDVAKNYLNSCAPNAILFTEGDNDTYPLWYAQEVEGIRPDIRIINLSLLSVDWYIDQLHHKNNKADAVDMYATIDKYEHDTRDQLPYIDAAKYGIAAANIDADKYYDLNNILNFIYSDNVPGTKLDWAGDHQLRSYLPTKKLLVPVNKVACLNQGIKPLNDTMQFPSELKWDLNKTTLIKSDLITLDIIAKNNWKRPIYFIANFATDARYGGGYHLGLEKYMQVEGECMRLTPFQVTQKTNIIPDYAPGYVNTDIMYKNVMNNFYFGGIKAAKGKVNIDETTALYLVHSAQISMMRLAEQLVNEGKKKEATQVLDKMFDELPLGSVTYAYDTYHAVSIYYGAGENAKARKLCDFYMDQAVKQFDFYFKLDSEEINRLGSDLYWRFVYYADQLTKTCILAKDKEQATKLINTLDHLYPNFEANFGKNNNLNTPDQLRQFVKQIQ